MAQYKSYQDGLVSENAVPSFSGMNKNLNFDSKRPALSLINGFQQHFLSKHNIWRDKSCSNQVVTQPAESCKFPIFEDEMQVSTPEPSPPKIHLPACVTKLYRCENIRDDAEMEDQENQSYWSCPDPPQIVSEREKLEQKWTAPYRNDIYCYLRDLEIKCRPSPSYMDKQTDITMNMRTILVDWLIEVGEEYKLQEETLHLAVSYTDRFLSRMIVLRSKLQLLGTTSMFIATKHEEIYPPELKDFVFITDNTYTKKQILKMEQLVLNVLNFDLAMPTAFTFLQAFANMASSSDKVSLLAQYICEISMLEVDPFLTYLPSQIAASCLALANYVLGQATWPDTLEEMTGYRLVDTDIQVIIRCLYQKYSTIWASPQQAVCEKYRSSKFQCVADVQCPKELRI